MSSEEKSGRENKMSPMLVLSNDKLKLDPPWRPNSDLPSPPFHSIPKDKTIPINEVDLPHFIIADEVRNFLKGERCVDVQSLLDSFSITSPFLIARPERVWNNFPCWENHTLLLIPLTACSQRGVDAMKTEQFTTFSYGEKVAISPGVTDAFHHLACEVLAGEKVLKATLYIQVPKKVPGPEHPEEFEYFPVKEVVGIDGWFSFFDKPVNTCQNFRYCVEFKYNFLHYERKLKLGVETFIFAPGLREKLCMGLDSTSEAGASSTS